MEDIAAALGLDEFSVIGISGGTPYALATLFRLGRRIRTVTVISGMGPMRLRGAFDGWTGAGGGARDRLTVSAPGHAVFSEGDGSFPRRPRPILEPLDRDMVGPRPASFRRKEVYDLFMKDLHQVFTKDRPRDALSRAGDLPALRVLGPRPAGGQADDPVARARRQHRPGVDGLDDGPNTAQRRVASRAGGPFRGGRYRRHIIARLRQLLDAASGRMKASAGKRSDDGLQKAGSYLRILGKVLKDELQRQRPFLRARRPVRGFPAQISRRSFRLSFVALSAS